MLTGQRTTVGSYFRFEKKFSSVKLPGTNINIPPRPDGTFDPRDIQRLKEFGQLIRDELSDSLPVDVMRVENDNLETQAIYDIKLSEKQRVKYVLLSELIEEGQRVESFQLLKRRNRDDWNMIEWQSFYEGQTIGHKKICKVDVETNEIRLFVTAARDVVKMKSIKIF